MFIKIGKEDKDVIIEEIKYFFSEERNEQIGDIASEAFLEFCIEKLGPYFYNAGVQDSIKLIHNRNTQTDDDLHSLKRSL
ncbi:DUF2164 domain-containing protein [Metabacillus litoralis]|uniref:DUF2164 domain-containing protein n=1 Tax=Metabacillus litoralis TaxID=152268 RepID=UPI001CFF05A2|nr:DUF2164 domain-containing protein [Metabacillus litoralis]